MKKELGTGGYRNCYEQLFDRKILKKMKKMRTNNFEQAFYRPWLWDETALIFCVGD